jgi:hypothetical protein
MPVFIFSWTINGLVATMHHLETRRQSVKLQMYKRLWYILIGSIIAIVAIFVANSINISNRNDPDWIANQWRWRWILLDGALNILFFIVFCSIAFIWMPTANNDRYGLDQLPSEDPDESYAVQGLEGGIKLRTLKGNQDDDKDGLIDVANDEEILNWAEQEFDGFDDNMTPSNSNDKLA